MSNGVAQRLPILSKHLWYSLYFYNRILSQHTIFYYIKDSENVLQMCITTEQAA